MSAPAGLGRVRRVRVVLLEGARGGLSVQRPGGVADRHLTEGTTKYSVPASAAGACSMTLRTQLAEFDAPIARALSWAVRHVPLDSRDDALQEARLRYWRVAERFDDSRGVSLDTYTQKHMTGAVKDFRRSQDLLSRVQRQKVQRGAADNVTQVGLVALRWTPNRGNSPERLAIAAEAHRLIDLTSGMGRTVLTIMCAGDKNLCETAAELGMSLASACQHRAKALRQIRRRIRLAPRICLPEPCPNPLPLELVRASSSQR